MANSQAELRALRIVERELGRKVELHDDRKRNALHDLRIGPRSAPEIAIECVLAADRREIEAWSIGAGKGPIRLNVESDWRVVHKPTARIKSLVENLEIILRIAESENYHGLIRVDWRLRRENREYYELLSRHKIEYLHRLRGKGSGVVTLGLPAIGGPVDTRGEALPGWVYEFLTHPDCGDVLRKLAKSGAAESHVFIYVSLSGVPWPVVSYLCSPTIEFLPEQPPTLPALVTGVWIVCGTNGLRWDGVRWKLFDPVVT